MFNTPFSSTPSEKSTSKPKQNTPLISSLIAIGNPIIDITSEVDKDCLKKYGLQWGHTTFADKQNIGFFDELEKMPKVTTTPGGSIENSLRVCSWCLNMDEEDKGKFRLTMLGCVGEDSYKKKIICALENSGVFPLFHTVQDEPTSRCGVGIYEKERTLVPDIHASNHLDENFVKQHIKEICEHDALIIEGYFLQENYEVCKMLAEEFNKAKKLVILTLSAVFIVKTHKEKIIELANMSDIVIGNMDEAKAMTGEKNVSIQETFEKIHKTLDPRNRIILVTIGNKGAFCSKFNYNRNTLDYVLQSFPNFIQDDEIVDLNGAGDAFTGGFLSQYMKGKPIHLCIKAGNDAAGVILRNVGCTFPLKLKLDFEG